MTALLPDEITLEGISFEEELACEAEECDNRAEWRFWHVGCAGMFICQGHKNGFDNYLAEAKVLAGRHNADVKFGCLICKTEGIEEKDLRFMRL